MHTATISHPLRSAHPLRRRWVAAAAGVTAMAGVAVIGIANLTESEAPRVPPPVTGWSALEEVTTPDELLAGLTEMVAAATGITLPAEGAPATPEPAGTGASEPLGGQLPAGTFDDLQSLVAGLPAAAD